MEDYSKFLSRVLRQRHLKQGIRDIVTESDNEFLDVAHLDWQAHLKNDGVFQRHDRELASFRPLRPYEFVVTQYVSSDEDVVKMVTVAMCYFSSTKTKDDSKKIYKPFFSVKICPPLDEIGKAYSKVGTPASLELSTNAKLFLESCGGPTICKYCYDYLKTNNIPLAEALKIDPWLCITTTKVYNGHEVFNALGDRPQSFFRNGPFWAVLRVVVNCRQFYGEKFNTMKISGVVKEMILFNEQFLDSSRPKKMNFFSTSQFACLTDSCTSSDGNAKGKMARWGEGAAVEEKEEDCVVTNYTFSRNVSAKMLEDTDLDKEDEYGTQNAIVCLPQDAMNSYLERQREKDEGSFELVHSGKSKLI